MKIEYLGCCDYAETYQKMLDFTINRKATDPDQLWLLQHPETYTTGTRNRHSTQTHINNIPLVISDRGGLTTFHGPGQITGYTLINLRQRQITIRQLVSIIENSLIAVLQQYGIAAIARKTHPVYI